MTRGDGAYLPPFSREMLLSLSVRVSLSPHFNTPRIHRLLMEYPLPLIPPTGELLGLNITVVPIVVLLSTIGAKLTG